MSKKYKKKLKINKFFRKIYLFRRKKIILLNIFILLIIYLLTNKLIIKNYTFTINAIHFSQNTVNTYINPQIEKSLIENLSGKNIFIVKFRKARIIQSEIKKERPIVKKINIKWNKKNKILTIDILFNKPTIIFFDGKRYLGRYKNKWFYINKSSIFLKEGFYYLPSYVQNLKYFSGFWYKITPHDLKKQLDTIKKFFGNGNITYFPGGEITQIILSGNQKIIINNQQNLSEQLKKYLVLKENLPKFKELKLIDLGALKDKIFIR